LGSNALGKLITSPGVEISDGEIHLDALERYNQSNIDFVDCTIAASAAAEGTLVATFDADFKSFPDVRVDLD
jgi:predicted nucleic acid-binding protein